MGCAVRSGLCIGLVFVDLRCDALQRLVDFGLDSDVFAARRALAFSVSPFISAPATAAIVGRSNSCAARRTSAALTGPPAACGLSAAPLRALACAMRCVS